MTEQANAFRLKRAKIFGDLIEKKLAKQKFVSILDIGGTTDYWLKLPKLWQGKQVKISIVNLEDGASPDAQLECLVGDACNMLEFEDNHFDIVHSNSVIEHVGHWNEASKMAGEVRRLAPTYYVQTPNICFPIEPHYRLPMVHWLPEHLRAPLLRKVKGQLPPDCSLDYAMRRVQSINLYNDAQVSALFPDARIVRERFLGFTKSLIAIRD